MLAIAIFSWSLFSRYRWESEAIAVMYHFPATWQ